MTRKSKKYQLLVITLLLCILQVAGIDVYAQSTVTPMKRDTTITQREARKPVPADIVNQLYKIL
ncbi:hypothetical protein BFINE_19570 [Bacteroides finegoldii DSM 17565]|nr:hypothetical protein BFINE_19570 [Bacteroides finegoldii DSM 17565]